MSDTSSSGDSHSEDSESSYEHDVDECIGNSAYLYEPYATSSSGESSEESNGEDSSDSSEDDTARLSNTNWYAHSFDFIISIYGLIMYS